MGSKNNPSNNKYNGFFNPNAGQRAPGVSMQVSVIDSPEDIIPMYDTIVVRKLDFDKTAGGVIIPEQAMKESLRGVVVAVGKGRFSEFLGRIMPLDFEVGDVIIMPIFNSLPPMKFECGSEAYFAINALDVKIKYREKARLISDAEDEDGASDPEEQELPGERDAAKRDELPESCILDAAGEVC